MALDINKTFVSADLTLTHTIKLYRKANAWGDAHGVDGVWNGANAYVFTIDIDKTDIWDPTVAYKIAKRLIAAPNTVETIQDDLMLGDIKMATDAVIHLADTTAHGATGANVGTTNSQTLTNKTIDADLNTLSNIDGEQFKIFTQGKEAKAFKIKPGADDSVIHIDASNVTTTVIQAANAAKSENRILQLKASSINLTNLAGGLTNVKITGLAAGTLSGEAVRWDEFDALDTRVELLEAGGTFGGAPAVTASVTIWRRIRSITGQITTTLRLEFTMDVANRGLERRWEIFHGPAEPNISAGSITADELDYLRDNFDRILLRHGEGNTYYVETIADRWFVFVAVDDSDNRYASDPIDSMIWREGGIPPGRDEAGDEITQHEVLSNPVLIAGTADDAAATEFSASDWKQSNVTPVIKTRLMYKHREGHQSLTVTCGLKVDFDTGYVKAELTARGGSAVAGKNATGSTVNTSYEDVVLTIPVSTGLTAGTRYELEISIWNSDPTPGSLTFLENAISVEVSKNIEVY